MQNPPIHTNTPRATPRHGLSPQPNQLSSKSNNWSVSRHLITTAGGGGGLPETTRYWLLKVVLSIAAYRWNRGKAFGYGRLLSMAALTRVSYLMLMYKHYSLPDVKAADCLWLLITAVTCLIIENKANACLRLPLTAAIWIWQPAKAVVCLKLTVAHTCRHKQLMLMQLVWFLETNIFLTGSNPLRIPRWFGPI